MTKTKHYIRNVMIAIVLILLIIFLIIFYRYQNPPTYFFYEPEQPYDQPTFSKTVASLHRSAVMRSFGFDETNYIINDPDSSISAQAFTAVHFDANQKISEGGTYIFFTVTDRENPDHLYLLWQNSHAVNYCYILEKQDDKYVLQKIKRTFGVRFQGIFHNQEQQESQRAIKK